MTWGPKSRKRKARSIRLQNRAAQARGFRNNREWLTYEIARQFSSASKMYHLVMQFVLAKEAFDIETFRRTNMF